MSAPARAASRRRRGRTCSTRDRGATTRTRSQRACAEMLPRVDAPTSSARCARRTATASASRRCSSSSPSPPCRRLYRSARRRASLPVFVTEHPVESSPLARRNEQDPRFVDRFELFVEGREVANAFSELNDPDDQAARFRAQLENRERGDEEAMDFDARLRPRAQHGMPPAAGLRHRRRSPGDAAVQPALDPRRAAVPAAQARDAMSALRRHAGASCRGRLRTTWRLLLVLGDDRARRCSASRCCSMLLGRELGERAGRGGDRRAGAPRVLAGGARRACAPARARPRRARAAAGS